MADLETKLDVRVYPLDDSKSATKAFASISVEDLIAIRGIRIVEGTKGLFVTMPQSKDQDGNYHDIAFPITGDLRKAMNKAVIDEFKAVTQTAEKSVQQSQKPEKPATTQKSAKNEPEL